MEPIRKLLQVFFVLFFLAPATTIRCDELDDLDSLSFEDLLENDFVNIVLENTKFECPPSKLGPGGTVPILKEIGILDVLEQNLYLRSNRLNSRSVVDLPLGTMDKDYCYVRRLFGLEFFFNKMDRAYFTDHSDCVCSYLALTDQDFLEALADSAEKSKDLAQADFDFDPAEIFDLFKCGTVQERKLGTMIYGRMGEETWRFTYRIPVFYQERNLWITEPEQEEIERQLGETTPENQQHFQDCYAISDKFGIGDFRIAFERHLTDSDRACTRIGGFATIPTAWALAKGLKGRHFEPLIRGPHTDLCDVIGYHLDSIFELAIDENPQSQEKVTEILTDLAFLAIEHFDSILLEAPMGNGRHFGIGATFRSMWNLSALIKVPWAEKIWMKGHMTLEYLFPGTEMRMFAEKPSPKLQDQAFKNSFGSEATANEDMLFIERELVSKLFPYALECTVSPGLVFGWTSRWYHERELWGIYLGSDTWMRSRERFSDLCVPKFLEDRLCTSVARRPFAFQSKVLGGFYYKFNKPNRNLVLSLNGEATTWNRGIGGDYTVSIDLEFNF